MKYRTRIRSNISNTETWSGLLEYNEASEYHWSQGNMGCDCNLEAYFDNEPQTGMCGGTRYTTLYLEKENGSIISLDEYK